MIILTPADTIRLMTASPVMLGTTMKWLELQFANLALKESLQELVRLLVLPVRWVMLAMTTARKLCVLLESIGEKGENKAHSVNNVTFTVNAMTPNPLIQPTIDSFRSSPQRWGNRGQVRILSFGP